MSARDLRIVASARHEAEREVWDAKPSKELCVEKIFFFERSERERIRARELISCCLFRRGGRRLRASKRSRKKEIRSLFSDALLFERRSLDACEHDGTSPSMSRFLVDEVPFARARSTSASSSSCLQPVARRSSTRRRRVRRSSSKRTQDRRALASSFVARIARPADGWNAREGARRSTRCVGRFAHERQRERSDEAVPSHPLPASASVSRT